MAVVGIVYVLWGWSMGWSGDGTFFANPFTMFGLNGVATSDYIYVMFQMTFAVITAALISGAIADRVKFSAWLVFLPIWATLVYFPLAHMVFSCTDSALICTQIGAQDYAGGTAVHINAGMAGLVLAVVVGKRLGWPKDKMRPHNLTLTMLGAACCGSGGTASTSARSSSRPPSSRTRAPSWSSSTPRPAGRSPTRPWPPWPPSSAGSSWSG